jgi:hypothetical protein
MNSTLLRYDKVYMKNREYLISDNCDLRTHAMKFADHLDGNVLHWDIRRPVGPYPSEKRSSVDFINSRPLRVKKLKRIPVPVRW